MSTSHTTGIERHIDLDMYSQSKTEILVPMYCTRILPSMASQSFMTAFIRNYSILPLYRVWTGNTRVSVLH